MNEPLPDLDRRAAVIVPARPGPLARFADLERNRDEIDDVLDDLFGEPDDQGPGPVDAILGVGGVGAIVAGQVASLPTAVTVCGAVAIALGAVLPVRSLWRRAAAARRSRRLQAMLGDGAVLRTDDAGTERLVAAHQRLLRAVAPLVAAPRAQVEAVAHAALFEVATLLDGRRPSTQVEIDYVSARTGALEDLAATVADPRVGDGEADRRRAMVEARYEVEQLSGRSSVTDASDLSRELLGTDGS